MQNGNDRENIMNLLFFIFKGICSGRRPILSPCNIELHPAVGVFALILQQTHPGEKITFIVSIIQITNPHSGT